MAVQCPTIKKTFPYKQKLITCLATTVSCECNLIIDKLIEIIDKLIEISIDSIEGHIENYQETGSAWYFKEVDKLEIHTVEYNPTKGSSYIPLPDWISNKKAIVNIENKDEKCFLWCILRYLHPKERDEERLTGLKSMSFHLTPKELLFL